MKKQKNIVVAIAFGVIMLMASTALAMEDVPVIDDARDFSSIGKHTYTYEGDYVVESYEVTPEEIKLGEELQKWHTHPQGNTRHFSLTAHTHSIKNIKTGSSRSYTWRPTSTWTRNSKYRKSSDWPTVSWSTSESKTVSASINMAVDVPASMVSTKVGVDFGKSHTISTSTTRTFKVPYKKDGRVKVTYSRPYKTFTCVTKYVVPGPPLTEWEETGSGNALGKPTNIVCDLETRKY